MKKKSKDNLIIRKNRLKILKIVKLNEDSVENFTLFQNEVKY